MAQHHAVRPASPTGWREVLICTAQASLSDRLALSAAGCAFCATLALFPAMSMLISLYGLVFNPRAVEAQVLVLRDLLPTNAYWLIADRLHHLVVQPPARLGTGLGVALLITVWSGAFGVRSMLAALALAFDEPAAQQFLRRQRNALALAVLAILGGVFALSILVGMPAALHFVHPWMFRVELVHAASIVLLLAGAGAAIALLYRFACARTSLPRLPGVVLALCVWLAASLLLTFYIQHIAAFGVTYGPIGAIIAVMLWFFLAAYAVLLGAELNAQLERVRLGSAPDLALTASMLPAAAPDA